MQKFYDTCALLELQNQVFKKPFFMSNITLKELEQIKDSSIKDFDIKHKARKLIHLLDENENNYTIINYQKNWDEELKLSPILMDNNDSRIIITALHLMNESTDSIRFITADLNCKKLAQSAGLDAQYLRLEKDNYTGFKEVSYLSEEDLAEIYNNLYKIGNSYNLLINEYLLIKNGNNNEIIDKYKYTKDGIVEVSFPCFESKMFGKVKPKDAYQTIAMDSLKSNKLTMIRGSAGTGKSYLALGYLFAQLEKHKIDKIIIFCNTVATAGAARLGFYPGDRTQKLLDSQIGNFLASKLGDKMAVERMIQENELELLPLADIRGYDTSGLNAGIYITEAQNLDIDLMKLALQRVGEDSICILDGDDTCQVDMPIYAGYNNGMRRVSEIFKGDPAYGEVTLQNIHRSHIARLAEQL